MAIFYIDFENGNDANDGSTWALAWKTFEFGATAARIAPGDEIRVAKSADPTSLGQTALWTGSDGQFVNIRPTSSSNTSPIVITKDGHGLQSGDIVKIFGHTINTNANGLWKVTYISDSQFSLDGSSGNGTGASSGYFIKSTNKVVQLTTPVTQDICNCDSIWTAGAGCTVSLETAIVKEGLGSAKIVCGSGTNQILAKFALPSSIDLSAYEQISFWFQSSAAITAGMLEIRLYSDAACTALVESLPFSDCVGFGRIRPEVINKGSALSATVQGIALYAVTSQSGRTMYLDNIIACKAASEPDSLTLRSLISKNIENENGDHAFLGIQAIVGSWVLLDNVYNTYTNVGRGYSGQTENVTAYKREGIIIDINAGNAQRIMDSGTAENHIKFIGGFNPETNIRDGYTVIDGLTQLRTGIYGYGRNYVDLSYFQVTRFDGGILYFPVYGDFLNLIATNNTTGFRFYTAFINSIFSINNATGITTDIYSGGIIGTLENCTSNNSMFSGIEFITDKFVLITNLICNNNEQNGIRFSLYSYNVDIIKSVCYNKGSGIFFNSGTGRVKINRAIDINFNSTGITFSSTYSKIYLINNLNYNNTAINFSSSNNYVYKIEKANYSSAYLFNLASSNFNYVYEINESIAAAGSILFYGQALEFYVFKGNFSGYPLTLSTDSVRSIYFIDCILDKLDLPASLIIADGRVYQHNYNLSGNHYIATEYGYIENDSLVRHTESGFSWKIAITSSYRHIEYPIKFSIAKIFCSGGSQAILSCWVKKTHASDIGAKLLVDHYSNVTVASDVSTEASETTEWQQLILYITPTADGVVELTLEVYWQSGDADEFVYVDDVSAAQLI
ncbi:MAG: right-handed parallel beta-helix repeat-containing protein [Bacteroidales bacterium]